MTKDELMKLAVAYANASERLRTWGMQQRPYEPARMLQSDAEFKIAQSVLEKARCEYEAAISSLSASELDQLMWGKSAVTHGDN